MKRMYELSFDYIVTGHYARVEYDEISFNKSGIIAVRHETDVLAVRLIRIDKAFPLCNIPNLCFVIFSQREQRVGQLLLGQIIKDIALVLGSIHALF